MIQEYRSVMSFCIPVVVDVTCTVYDLIYWVDLEFLFKFSIPSSGIEGPFLRVVN